jgi:phosphopantothenoylcysteine decarboxylase/phosphopantothenate--cysteine ligase
MISKSAKEVLLGVSGSIAAYKACELASQLVKLGLNVTAVLTHSAAKLVGPATFEGLTGRKCITGMFESDTASDIEHVTIAQRADLVIVAPATANVMAKHAWGIADDWLLTALLATKAPILFAPAMNTQMYEHSATQENMAVLRMRGCHIIPPDAGVLACKTIGVGKMADPARIVEAALPLLDPQPDLAKKRVLITTGANHEPIDAVRFIGNRSSGKMGYEIALEAIRRGADVTVIAGPADVDPPYGAKVIPVETAQQMCDEAVDRARRADIIIGVAAVADYRVAGAQAEKRKRNGQDVSLKLVENPDILASIGKEKRADQLLVGFAAETNDLEANARAKIAKKNLDLVVANSVASEDSTFGADTIRAQLLTPSSTGEALPLQTKRELARTIFDRIATLARALPKHEPAPHTTH